MSCVRVQLYHSSFSSLFTSFAIRESSFILAISPFNPSTFPLSILHPMQRQVDGSVCVWSSNIRLVNVQTIYIQMRLGPTSPVGIGNYLPGLHIMPGKWSSSSSCIPCSLCPASLTVSQPSSSSWASFVSLSRGAASPLVLWTPVFENVSPKFRIHSSTPEFLMHLPPFTHFFVFLKSCSWEVIGACSPTIL